MLGLRPFDVQLIGAMILHKGEIAEMRTGEGKTLVAVLPAYLNALSGKGVQVYQLPCTIGLGLFSSPVWDALQCTDTSKLVSVCNVTVRPVHSSCVNGSSHGSGYSIKVWAAVQVVTVNDYLARRDSEWVGQVHKFLGLRVGLVQQGLNESERKAAYRADVTYVTNSELGFDYLRDNLAQVCLLHGCRALTSNIVPCWPTLPCVFKSYVPSHAYASAS